MSNFRSSKNRVRTRHYSASRPARPGRSSARPKRHGQYIHPSKFVKAANPAQAANYRSTNSFADFAIHPLLKSNIAIKGYKTPSEIQDKAIPVGLSGRDIIGIANTGTGKTAAFAIPILNKLLRQPGSTALIIAPTRELAIQIEEQCKLFAKSSGLSGALLIGGLTIGRQFSALKGEPSIYIGTPGRLKDHVNKGSLNLSKCSMIVLDEVDRMLDMGFINDIRFLLDRLPEQRQSYFFSATVSPEINRLIDTFTKDPVTINVKTGETTDNVHQDIVAYSTKPEKLKQLDDVLNSGLTTKTLIFSETKHGAERLSKELIARGFKADSLHGGKNQSQRKRSLDSFRDGRIEALVATDVAARGIDVLDISHVINFDVPHTYDDYIHRIGRAGRAGRIGHALTFVEAPASA